MSTTTTETELERTVREEQEQHDQEQAADHDGLFDKARYDDPELALPKVDDQGIDRISIKFTGEVFLDRTDPADVALFRRLKLGQDVTLMVEAKVAATAARGATDREGDLDVVVGSKTAKVHTVYRPTEE